MQASLLVSRLRPEQAFLYLSLKMPWCPLALHHLSNPALKKEWEEVWGANC